jgi:exodeoxyribonuclease VII large subunit
VARLDEAKNRVGLAAASLDALSPLAVLQRGYAIAQDKDGRLVREAQAIAPGDFLRVRLAKGRLNCRVEDAEEN